MLAGEAAESLDPAAALEIDWIEWGVPVRSFTPLVSNPSIRQGLNVT